MSAAAPASTSNTFQDDNSTKDGAAAEKAQPHPLLYKSTGSDVLVTFDGEKDPLNPQNWSTGKKIATTALWALTTCWITFASAIYSAGTYEISQEFDVSYNVANLGTALLVFGFAVGPMIWAPLCELYGRKWTALAVCSRCTIFDLQMTNILTFITSHILSAPCLPLAPLPQRTSKPSSLLDSSQACLVARPSPSLEVL